MNADTPTATCQSQGYVAGFLRSGRLRRKRRGLEQRRDLLLDRPRHPRNGQLRARRRLGRPGRAGHVPARTAAPDQLFAARDHQLERPVVELARRRDEHRRGGARVPSTTKRSTPAPDRSARAAPGRSSPIRRRASSRISCTIRTSMRSFPTPRRSRSARTMRADSRGAGERGSSRAGWATRWAVLYTGSSNAVRRTRITDIQQVTGQTFPALFANFGLALYTDSLPGLPRNDGAAGESLCVTERQATLGADSSPRRVGRARTFRSSNRSTSSRSRTTARPRFCSRAR